MKVSGTPSPMELDALAETGNIGMGHAAAALARLMQREVRLEVPSLTFLDPKRPTPPFGPEEAVGLSLEISGGLCGSLLILLPTPYALQMVARRPEQTGGEASYDEGEIAVLTSGGSALAQAYLEALGRLLKLPLSFSPPLFECAPVHQIADAVLRRCRASEPPLMIQTVFSVPGLEGAGRILLIPGAEGVEAILSALGTR